MTAPAFASTEVLADRRVVFRVFALRANDVRLVGTDLPRNTPGLPMTKGDNRVWEATTDRLPPGAYRYNFNVNGVATIESRNPGISESNNNVWSVVYEPGADFMETKDVPLGRRCRRSIWRANTRACSRRCDYIVPEL